jgi:hypothetical protein
VKNSECSDVVVLAFASLEFVARNAARMVSLCETPAVGLGQCNGVFVVRACRAFKFTTCRTVPCMDSWFHDPMLNQEVYFGCRPPMLRPLPTRSLHVLTSYALDASHGF